MSRLNCRLLTIVTEALLEQEVCELLVELGASGYTITDARGAGSRGVRSAEWRTAGNVRIEILCSAELAEKIAKTMKTNYYEDYAMVVFETEAHVLRLEKFS